MERRLIADRIAMSDGPRLREFARICRQTAERSADPKVMAMTRGMTAARKPLDRHLALSRRMER